MTDTTPTPGQNLDAAIAAVEAAIADLKEAVNTKAAEVGEQIISRVDAASAAVDELQARWADYAH